MYFSNYSSTSVVHACAVAKKNPEVQLTPFMRFSWSPAGCPLAAFFCLERGVNGEVRVCRGTGDDDRAQGTPDSANNAFCGVSVLCESEAKLFLSSDQPKASVVFFVLALGFNETRTRRG